MKKGVSLGVIALLIVSLLTPFSLSADSINISGSSISIYSLEMTQDSEILISGDYYRRANVIFQIVINFDDYYVGNVNLNYSLKWWRYNVSGTSSAQHYLATRNRSNIQYPVNGNQVVFYESVNLYMMINDTGDDILGAGAGISGLSVSSADVRLARDWEFPIESFTWINYLFNVGYQKSSVLKIYQYTFPIFQLSSTLPILRDYTSKNAVDKIVVFAYPRNLGINSFNTYFDWYKNKNMNTLANDLVEIYDFQTLFRGWQDQTGTEQFRIFSFKYHCKSDSAIDLYLKSKDTSADAYFMPIYFNFVNNTNISLDFALNFGLSNILIDYLSGNSAQDSINDNDDITQEFTDQADLIVDLESSFTDDFESSLNNPSIDVNTTPQSLFGSSFTASASWLRSAFNHLTLNNPFGSLLTYSLLLGLALLIIGRLLG